MVVTKQVPRADSCDFSTLLLMIANDDEALRGERKKNPLVYIKRRQTYHSGFGKGSLSEEMMLSGREMK